MRQKSSQPRPAGEALCHEPFVYIPASASAAQPDQPARSTSSVGNGNARRMSAIARMVHASCASSDSDVELDDRNGACDRYLTSLEQAAAKPRFRAKRDKSAIHLPVVQAIPAVRS